MTDRIPLKKAHLLSNECLDDAEDEVFIAGNVKCSLQLSGGSTHEMKLKAYKGFRTTQHSTKQKKLKARYK
jgi:hypothetical protein